MQQLHLVGLTTDLEGLIFSARRGAKSGGYVVSLDEELLQTIADTVMKRNGEVSSEASTARVLARAAGRVDRPASTLSPREIQARLRAGHTIDEVAREAGVDGDWVERFAAPVRAEQAQVIEKAGRLHFDKPRVGTSAQSLEVSVRWNLIDRGVRFAPRSGWAAHHVRDSYWVIRFAYQSRGRAQVAEWELDLRDGSLLARNRLATQLAYVPPGRRRRAIPDDALEEEAPTKARTRPAKARVSGTKKAPARKAAGSASATRTRSRTAATKKAPAKRALAKKAPAKRAAPTRAPAAREGAPKKAPPRKAAPARKAAAPPAPAPLRRRQRSLRAR